VIVAIVAALLLIGFLSDGKGFAQTLMKGLALGSVYALVALGSSHLQSDAHDQLRAGSARRLRRAVPLLRVHRRQHPVHEVAEPDRQHRWTWVDPLDGCLGLALFFAAILGLVVERLTIRPMVGKPLFSVAVITLGLEIVLRVFATDATKIQFRQLGVPWGTSSFEIGGIRYSWSYIAAVLTAAIAFVAVFLFYRSRMGVAMRAVSYDQEAAMAQGINVGRVFAIAWAAGAVLATLGGIYATQPPLSQTGAVGPETAFVAFRALPAVILGGLDSVQGALLGGLTIGIAEIMAGQYLADYSNTLGSGYTLIVPYVVMIIGLLVRPYGMFGTPEVRRV
jgi:branched-chain amino acid transport system permease protein